MAKVIAEIKGMNVFEHEYDKWRNHEQCSGLIGYGVAYKFHRWLVYHDLIWEDVDVDDTFNNLSECRDGNRFDIHDNYVFDEEQRIEISFLYVVNGNLWATLEKDNSWYGDVEIENV